MRCPCHARASVTGSEWLSPVVLAHVRISALRTHLNVIDAPPMLDPATGSLVSLPSFIRVPATAPLHRRYRTFLRN
jgi:hypothetical protein